VGHLPDAHGADVRRALDRLRDADVAEAHGDLRHLGIGAGVHRRHLDWPIERGVVGHLGVADLERLRDSEVEAAHANTSATRSSASAPTIARWWA
jgi:hypothetical protein